MSMLHRQLLSQILADIEPVVLHGLEAATAAFLPAAAPVVDMALEAGDAAVRANNPAYFATAAAADPAAELAALLSQIAGAMGQAAALAASMQAPTK
jgi:hypothetical protein